MPGFYEKRQGYKAPDVKAPRFRKERLMTLTPQLFRSYKEKYPESKLTFKQFRDIILTFNRKVVSLVIHSRDGVELPAQLGFVFIASCPKKKDKNPIHTLSAENNQQIQHKNWESDQYLCKIFYSNFGTKYRFAGRENWYFKACRAFSREASIVYRKQWNLYRKISAFEKVTSFLRAQGVKSIKVQKHESNNRRIDFSGTQPD